MRGERLALVVEDSLDEAYLVRELLEEEGIALVTHAQDGDTAARLIRERDWDLVVVDLNLPGIDGYDLIRLVKAKHPPTPTIAITGYTAERYIEQAFRAGADHVLNKPINRDDFLSKAVEAVGERAESATAASFALAIGALPGDIESGCCGALLAARASGHGVLLIPMAAGTAAEGSAREAQRRAAEIMGARIIMTGASVSHAEDPTEHQLLLERIVRELKPVIAFVPSLADDDPRRREAHRISRTAVAEVPLVLAYETGTSTPDFRPSRFLDIEPWIEEKLEVVGAYQDQARPDLDPAYVSAAARHWGRHLHYGAAEAFEVLRAQGEHA